MATRLNRVIAAVVCLLAVAGGVLVRGQDTAEVQDTASVFEGTRETTHPVWREPQREVDAVNFIGMDLAELFENFGPPRAVHTSRGIDVWQDDVVFEYAGVDFYIYNDRVWQVSLDAGNGISKGDPRAAVLLVLGDTARDNESYIMGKLSNTSWPLEWRFNIENGKVSAIYLYRMDY